MKANGRKKERLVKANGSKKVRLRDVGLASAAGLAMLLAPLPTLAALAGALVATRRQQSKRK